MTTSKLSDIGILLQSARDGALAYEKQQNDKASEGAMVQVERITNLPIVAYEQLRNASENIEDHLLVQKAIYRFYRRNMFLIPKGHFVGLGRELVVELTQAEYIKNDSVSDTTVQEIDELIKEHFSFYKEALVSDRGIKRSTYEKWTLEILSVKTEQLLHSFALINSYVYFVHSYLSDKVKYNKIIESDENVAPEEYSLLLYIAIHKALLKSDDANIRSGLLGLYSFSISDTTNMITFNTKYDELVSLDSTAKLTRFVTKNGAPFQIIKSTFFKSQVDKVDIDVSNESRIMELIGDKVDEAYRLTRKSINKGFVKSVAFLLITKVLIGLMVEIPYDTIVTGSIVVLPLLVNLILPPVLIAITGLTLRLPGEENRKSIKHYIQTMIYESDHETSMPTLKYNKPTRGFSVFNVTYGVLLIAVFLIIGYYLQMLHYNIVQAVIFFIFASTASFLGYRLTLQAKALELVGTHQGIGSNIRDFIYLPFIIVGRRVSYKFKQLNLVAQVLDLAIDLPLKTTIRLIRQWGAFINGKRDDLL